MVKKTVRKRAQSVADVDVTEQVYADIQQKRNEKGMQKVQY